MVDYAPYNRGVDDVEIVTPEVITKEVLDSIDHSETDLARQEGTMKICIAYMDALKADSNRNGLPY